MAEFETERLTAHAIGEDDRGWQKPVRDGRNPVDAVMEDWMDGGEVISADLMFPLILAYLTGLTVTEARAMVEAEQAKDPQNWIDRLRAHWPPSSS